jgi:hypothetical protein
MSADAVVDGGHPLRGEVKLLLQVAMVVFVWTVVIGILNGTDIVDFDRNVLLSHVHAGTLGWITTSVIAACLWLFGTAGSEGEIRAGRWLGRATVVVLPVFAITFAFTTEDPRAVLGALAMLVIVGTLAWVVVRARRIEVSTVHLGFLAAVATSVVGAVIGVLVAAEMATGRDVIGDGGYDAHPATMVVGFLVPVGMALAEWGLRGSASGRAGRLGWAQMGLPFAGGVLLMLGLLLDIDPLPPLATIIELVGVGIFFKRMWPELRAVVWGDRTPGRYAAAAALAIIVNIIFLNYVVGANGGDIDAAPMHQILALDHTMFIGVVTNALFALHLVATAGRTRWPQLDRYVFVGMNAGLAVFVVALLAESTWMMRIATPVLGLAILAGLLDRTLALQGTPSSAPDVGMSPATAPT